LAHTLLKARRVYNLGELKVVWIFWKRLRLCRVGKNAGVGGIIQELLRLGELGHVDWDHFPGGIYEEHT